MMSMSRSSRLRTSLAFAGLAVAAGTAALLASWLRSGKTGNPDVAPPAKAVDLGRYLGRWYELGRYENRFERACEGVTAEYAHRPDGLVDIVNSCRSGDLRRVSRISKGRAKVVRGSGNARLKVSFFGPFYFGNYWVLDHADDYRWSIVGEPSGRFLWILARDPTPPQKEYDDLVNRASALGYEMSRFRRTRHRVKPS